jgi:2-amino-4-hydroxy-6-hydroxymethyldihydropteridine diphosphokinase
MFLLLGLGGNLGDVPAAFSRAAGALAGRFRLVSASSLWRSAPLGPPQPDYLNAAILVESDSPPLAVLGFTRLLEARAGREREREARWGPRPLDLDVLLAPGLVVVSPALVLPHPRLPERRFALAPAAEIVPEWLHPLLHRTVAELAAAPAVAGQRCTRSGPFPDF